MLGSLPISRLTLGTVQFGLPYGIANRRGQPSFREVCDILAAALEGGVTCLDTAAGYGESEAVLGKALRELGIGSTMTVVSKCRHLAERYESRAIVDRLIAESVAGSLTRLGLETIPIYLFHREDNVQYLDSLEKLKQRGLVRHIGVSCNTPAAAARIASSDPVEAMQIPTSLLDRRYRNAGVYDSARRRGITLFVRSVYLQGLLLLDDPGIPEELAEVLPVLEAVRRLAAEAGISVGELALRYAMGIEGAASLVVGVETVAQVRENSAAIARGPLEPSLAEAVDAVVPDLSEKILTPSTWSRRMPDIAPAPPPGAERQSDGTR